MITKKRRWLLTLVGIFLLVSPNRLSSQPKLAVTNAGIRDVQVVPFLDPSFSSLVRIALPSQNAYQAAEAALPYSVVVRNSGAHTVVLFAMKYEVVDSDGRKSGGVQIRDYRTSEPKLKSGSAQLVTLSPGLTQYLVSPQPSSTHSSYPAFMAELEKSRRSREATFSLDSVLFETGEFAGPDQANTFGLLTAETAALRDLFQQLQAMRGSSDDQVSRRLTEVIQRAERAPEPAQPANTMVFSRFSQYQCSTTANLLQRLLAERGRSAFDERVSQALTGLPAVWRQGGAVK